MYCNSRSTECKRLRSAFSIGSLELGRGLSRRILPVLIALLFSSVASGGSDKTTAVADDNTPALGDNRLFVEDSRRKQLDRLSDMKVAPAVDTEPVAATEIIAPETLAPETLAPVTIASEIAAPVVKTTSPRVPNPPERKTGHYVLNGIVRRSNGVVDVWVNGKEVPAWPEVEVARVEPDGSVILRIEGEKYSLYPGQSVQVGGAAGESDSTDLAKR